MTFNQALTLAFKAAARVEGFASVERWEWIGRPRFGFAATGLRRGRLRRTGMLGGVEWFVSA